MEGKTLNFFDNKILKLSRGSGLKETIKTEEVLKKVTINPVRLGEHIKADCELDQFWKENIAKYNSENNGFLRHTDDPGEQEYLGNQVDRLLAENIAWQEELDKGSLESFLEIAYKVVARGSGGHHDKPTGERISTTFNIDSPPQTRCNVFNSLYMQVFRYLVRENSPDWIDKHALVMQSSNTALDMPRIKSKYTGNSGKTVPHAYLTLISVTEEGLIYSPIDPYHVSDPGHPLDSIDFNGDRQTDSFRAMLDIAFVNVDNQNQMRELQSVAVLPMLESASVEDLGEMGLLITSNYWPQILMASISAETDFLEKRKTIVHKIEGYQKAKATGGSLSFLKDLKSDLLDSYGKAERSYTSLRFRHKFFVDLQNEFAQAADRIVGVLINEIKDGNITEEKARKTFIFLDLLDNVGYHNLSVEGEFWDKVLEFVDKDLRAKKEEWKKALSQEKGESLRRNNGFDLIKRHFVNGWGIQPTQTVLTNSDNQPMKDESENLAKYNMFKAKVLGWVHRIGINGWEDKIPKTVTEGSYAELFLKTLSLELEET